MPTLKYKNGSNWVNAPTGNGIHTERWTNGSVTIKNNAYGTPTGTAYKEGVDAAGACNITFEFSNLRGAPGGTGGRGSNGPRGYALYSISAYRTTAFTLPNYSTDTFSVMRIPMTTYYVSTSWDNQALGSYPISYYSGSIRLSPNTMTYRYIVGIQGGICFTGVQNQNTGGSNCSVKMGIGYSGSSYTTADSWFVEYPIYWLRYQRYVCIPEKMISSFWSDYSTQGYYMLCARRNGGNGGTTDSYQCHLTATFYGLVTA